MMLLKRGKLAGPCLLSTTVLPAKKRGKLSHRARLGTAYVEQHLILSYLHVSDLIPAHRGLGGFLLNGGCGREQRLPVVSSGCTREWRNPWE
jgi:hypothetical protein